MQQNSDGIDHHVYRKTHNPMKKVTKSHWNSAYSRLETAFVFLEETSRKCSNCRQHNFFFQFRQNLGFHGFHTFLSQINRLLVNC